MKFFCKKKAIMRSKLIIVTLFISLLGISQNNPDKVYIAAVTLYWDDGLTNIFIFNDYSETFQQVDMTSKYLKTFIFNR